MGNMDFLNAGYKIISEEF